MGAQESQDLELAQNPAGVNDVCGEERGSRTSQAQRDPGHRAEPLLRGSPLKTLVIFLMASFRPVLVSWAALRWRGHGGQG